MPFIQLFWNQLKQTSNKGMNGLVVIICTFYVTLTHLAIDYL